MKYQPTSPALITAQKQQAQEQDQEEVLEDEGVEVFDRCQDRQAAQTFR